jgi:phosphoglycolate phosphatase
VRERRGLLIFDLDGTLFRGDAVTLASARRAFAERGLHAPAEEEVRRFVGRPPREFHDWLAAVCPPGIGNEVAEAVDRGELELLAEAGGLYPGVEGALAALRAATCRMAICTNGPPAYVDAVMDGFGLRRFFDLVRRIESPDDEKAGMVADVLARIRARPAIMIGDRPDDVAAARTNGLPAVAVTYGVGAPEELEDADALAGSPAEMAAAVLEALRRHRE